MKKIFALSAFLLVLLLLLPLFALTAEEVAVTPSKPTVTTQTLPESKTFKVLLSDSNTVVNLSVEDYLFGVIAGEMPALYEVEALKAQAVCAYTFALWRQKSNASKGYDISDDYTVDQCYITPKAAQEKWGSKADEYEEKIRSAIKEVDNETHLPVQIVIGFHDTSLRSR